MLSAHDSRLRNLSQHEMPTPPVSSLVLVTEQTPTVEQLERLSLLYDSGRLLCSGAHSRITPQLHKARRIFGTVQTITRVMSNALSAYAAHLCMLLVYQQNHLSQQSQQPIGHTATTLNSTLGRSAQRHCQLLSTGGKRKTSKPVPAHHDTYGRSS